MSSNNPSNSLSPPSTPSVLSPPTAVSPPSSSSSSSPPPSTTPIPVPVPVSVSCVLIDVSNGREFDVSFSPSDSLVALKKSLYSENIISIPSESQLWIGLSGHSIHSASDAKGQNEIFIFDKMSAGGGQNISPPNVSVGFSLEEIENSLQQRGKNLGTPPMDFRDFPRISSSPSVMMRSLLEFSRLSSSHFSLCLSLFSNVSDRLHISSIWIKRLKNVWRAPLSAHLNFQKFSFHCKKEIQRGEGKISAIEKAVRSFEDDADFLSLRLQSVKLNRRQKEKTQKETLFDFVGDAKISSIRQSLRRDVSSLRQKFDGLRAEFLRVESLSPQGGDFGALGESEEKEKNVIQSAEIFLRNQWEILRAEGGGGESNGIPPLPSSPLPLSALLEGFGDFCRFFASIRVPQLESLKNSLSDFYLSVGDFIAFGERSLASPSSASSVSFDSEVKLRTVQFEDFTANHQRNVIPKFHDADESLRIAMEFIGKFTPIVQKSFVLRLKALGEFSASLRGVSSALPLFSDAIQRVSDAQSKGDALRRLPFAFRAASFELRRRRVFHSNFHFDLKEIQREIHKRRDAEISRRETFGRDFGDSVPFALFPEMSKFPLNLKFEFDEGAVKDGQSEGIDGDEDGGDGEDDAEIQQIRQNLQREMDIQKERNQHENSLKTDDGDVKGREISLSDDSPPSSSPFWRFAWPPLSMPPETEEILKRCERFERETAALSAEVSVWRERERERATLKERISGDIDSDPRPFSRSDHLVVILSAEKKSHEAEIAALKRELRKLQNERYQNKGKDANAPPSLPITLPPEEPPAPKVSLPPSLSQSVSSSASTFPSSPSSSSSPSAISPSALLDPIDSDDPQKLRTLYGERIQMLIKDNESLRNSVEKSKASRKALGSESKVLSTQLNDVSRKCALLLHELNSEKSRANNLVAELNIAMENERLWKEIQMNKISFISFQIGDQALMRKTLKKSLQNVSPQDGDAKGAEISKSSFVYSALSKDGKLRVLSPECRDALESELNRERRAKKMSPVEFPLGDVFVGEIIRMDRINEEDDTLGIMGKDKEKEKDREGFTLWMAISGTFNQE